MAATDGQIILAAARWSSDDVLSLRDFIGHQRAEDLPRSELVKFVRGQFSNLGVPNLPNPSLHSNAILTTLGKTLKVAAQSVKFKDGKRSCSVSSGIRFAVPESYPGYFEILSEEGKAVKCIESVSELTKKFPESVLVRENVRGFVTTVPLSELSADKSRTINAGEILTLQKEVSLSRSSRSHRFLQCTDSKGDIVYLNIEQRGKFSPIARNDNISGVHSLRQLVTNKRLPLMVRLVWGPPPYKATSAQPPCSELRLFSAFEEETLFALPLGQHCSKDASNSLVSLPSGCNLKLVRARNHSEIRQTEPFQRLVSTSNRLAREINSRMTVLETFKDSISFWNISPNHSKHVGAKVSSKNYFLRRSVSHESQIVVAPISPVIQEEPEVAPTQDFIEIDQIYDYVRGFAPLPKNLRTNNYEDDPAPKPPPIETIPTNKQQLQQQCAPVTVEKKNRKLDRQRILKPSSKTALKMELHAQNLAQESLRSNDRARLEKSNKRLFKSKTTSSLADYIQLTSLTESHVDGEPICTSEKQAFDSSSTHLLTQADLSPKLNMSNGSTHNKDSVYSLENSSYKSNNDSHDLEPTYENTAQIYLETEQIKNYGGKSREKYSEIGSSKNYTSNHLYQKQRASSEIAHKLRESSPTYYQKITNSSDCSKQAMKNGRRKKTSDNSAHQVTSKSHEDLATKRYEKSKNIAQSLGSSPHEKCPEPLAQAGASPESEKALHTSLTSLRPTPPPTDGGGGGGDKKARRRRLSKQRSLTSLLAEVQPNTPVIEHRPVELHLQMSRASHHSSSRHSSKPKGSGAKLGILYL